MTPWSWWWLEDGESAYGGWQGDCATKEAAIQEATRELPHGTRFDVMEARSSTAEAYEGADCVPFLRTRNRERLITGPRAVPS